MNNTIQYIPISELVLGDFHPHLETTNDNLANLKNSIKNYGILEPLIVRPKERKFEIILGNRRYKAAMSLGMEKVPAIITNIDDAKALEFVISENIQRRELSSKEEANLYSKALSSNNISKEQLSINLGIPIDRIESKLNLLNKNDNIILNNNYPKEQNNNIEDNSINNDIISLKELENEEIEREDFYMNNQNLNSIPNNEINQLNSQMQNQQPTFGGRFFPSLEDEPTNMNLGGQIDINPAPPTLEPLQSTTNFSSPENNNSQLENQNPTDINNILPNIDIPSNNINIIPSITNEPSNPTSNMSEIPATPPLMDPTTINIPPIPNITSNINPDGNSNSQTLITNIETPSAQPQSESLPEMPNLDSNPISQPTQTPINSIENSNPIIEDKNININNIPNLNSSNIGISTSNEEPLQESKNILPIINMIKNLTIGLNELGYKINVTENDSATSYNINIEVEK